MDKIGTAFWLGGLLLALPIGIAVNLITPRAQKWFEGRSGRKSQAEARSLQRRIDALQFSLLTNATPSDIRLEGVLTTVWVSATGGVMSALCFSAAQIALAVGYAPLLNAGLAVLQAIGTLATVLTGLTAFVICNSAASKANDLRMLPSLRDRLEDLRRLT